MFFTHEILIRKHIGSRDAQLCFIPFPMEIVLRFLFHRCLRPSLPRFKQSVFSLRCRWSAPKPDCHYSCLATVVDRIRTLFYIALGNFIFPVIFNILLLLVLFRGNKIDVIYIVPANTYVTILGVVFATGTSRPLVSPTIVG